MNWRTKNRIADVLTTLSLILAGLVFGITLVLALWGSR